VSSDGGSFGHLGIHVGADWRVQCSTYPSRTPILDIDAGSVCVALSVQADSADERTVAFARALAAEAQRFAAEVERLHTEWHPAEGKAA
jgi:hypothetical protein